MADVDFETFVNFCVDELGYEINPNNRIDTGKVQCVCHYHNDGKNPNKKFGSTSLISKDTYKGIHCFACGASKSFVTMVMEEKNMYFNEALSFIMEKLGMNKSIYAIPGTETEWERKNMVRHVSDPLEEIMPPLTPKELKLIGLKGISGKNYEIIAEYTPENKPEQWELEKGESLIKIEEENPEYIPGAIPEYEDFMHYIAGVKNVGGSSEEPFNTRYLKTRRIQGYSLNDLYSSDKKQYHHMIICKLFEAMTDRELALRDDNISSFVKYNIKKELKILYDIRDRYMSEEVVKKVYA
jgi:hypothetical protein